MKKRFYPKIVSTYFILILSIFAAIFMLSLILLHRNTRAAQEEEIGRIVDCLRPSVAYLIQSGDTNLLNQTIESVGSAIGMHIAVFDSNRALLYDFYDGYNTPVTPPPIPDLIEAAAGKTTRGAQLYVPMRRMYLWRAAPVNDATSMVGLVYCGELFNARRYQIVVGSLALVLLLALATAVITSFIIPHSLVKSLDDLRDAARAITEGNFDARVFVDNDDDIKEVADSFNTVIDQVAGIISGSRIQSEELSTIIRTIHEGLIVLDAQGRIIVSNPSFNEIIQTDVVAGSYYWDVIRSAQLNDIIAELHERKTSITREIEFSGRIYLCSASYSAAKQELVLLFLDVTDMKNLEKSKRDFVMNVSHELRTPLTAIKGFIETMEDDIDGANKQYLDIIKRHTNRLISMVEDLLVLSRLERDNAAPEVDAIDVADFFRNMQTLFQRQLDEKKLSFSVSIDDSVARIKADSFKIEQIFVNLIDNAIKYTEKGGIAIIVRPSNAYVELVIEDTGIGIPEQDLNRVFERFYVVDKSRSRKLGGTGLGLSIVRALAMQQNGKIRAERIPDSGSRFVLSLPR